MRGGGPRGTALLREAWVSAWARPVATGTTALVVAVVCLVTLATTGRTAATEHQVMSTIDSLGTRLITVVDTTGESGIDASAVDQLIRLEGVEWAFGLGPARDVVIPAIGTAPSGTAVAARPVVGGLPPDIALDVGRPPRAGEAVIGARAAAALGLADTAGEVAIQGERVAVVGRFVADGAFDTLTDSVVTVPHAEQAPPLRYVYVRAADGYAVQSLARSIEALVPAANPATVEVQISDNALQLRSVLSGTLGASARQLMAIVLGTGLLLVAVTVTGAVAARRRDFGRQRALGATRSAIVALVLTQSGIAAGIGTLLGLAVGLPVTRVIAGALPSPAFTAGLATLAVLVGLLGAVVPAALAARRDPVRILRVP